MHLGLLICCPWPTPRRRRAMALGPTALHVYSGRTSIREEDVQSDIVDVVWLGIFFSTNQQCAASDRFCFDLSWLKDIMITTKAGAVSLGGEETALPYPT